ncbi:universal stress protein [Rivibacter subsaxonicus]|uniref:universal stress protein n=1 Tax=Rivibacter subsaxonicus TaxID=457575 RepID=UPI0013EE6F1B|nr:universal stress protein [Rivibacter subsaxonicus]
MATDFSIDGNNAVRRAALLAHEHGARLKLVHVLDPTGCKPLRDWFSPSIDIDLKAAQARESLRRFAVEIAGRYDVTATVEVVVGELLESLMQASERAELLVLGRRGHSRFQALLVGRTVDRLLRTCRRPVLVVKTSVEGAYRRVLVPVDFTAPSLAAVQVAARLARDSSMHVFHSINSHREAVLRETDMPEHVIRESRLRRDAGTIARMRRQAARLGLDSTRMGFAVAHGHPVWSTLRHARWLGADLIVAGKQGRSTLGEFLLGSVSRRVLAESSCDMLIVPQPCKKPLAHATSPQMRLAEPAGQVDTAALARSAAALAGALTPAQWPETAERSLSRRLP